MGTKQYHTAPQGTIRYHEVLQGTHSTKRYHKVPQGSTQQHTGEMEELDVANALHEVLHVLLHPRLLSLLCQQRVLHSVNFRLQLLDSSFRHFCLHLSVSKPLLDRLDLLFQVLLPLAVIVALDGETLHCFVDPSKLRLQHGYLSITPGSPLLCAVLVVLPQHQFPDDLLTLGVRLLRNPLRLRHLPLEHLQLVPGALELGLHMLPAIVGLSKVVRSALEFPRNALIPLVVLLNLLLNHLEFPLRVVQLGL